MRDGGVLLDLVNNRSRIYEEYVNRSGEMRKPLIEQIPDYPNFRYATRFMEIPLDIGENRVIPNNSHLFELSKLVLPPD